MVNAAGPNPVPITTIPFRGNCQSFLCAPVSLVRYASRFGELSFSGADIFTDHSIRVGVGFCATLGYPAQRTRPDARRLRR
jgi:hypothetical protein